MDRTETARMAVNSARVRVHQKYLQILAGDLSQKPTLSQTIVSYRRLCELSSILIRQRRIADVY